MFCRLLWRDLRELVSLMARNLDCSMETLYELCESWLCRGVGEEISGQRRDGQKNIYMMRVEVKRGHFLARR